MSAGLAKRCEVCRERKPIPGTSWCGCCRDHLEDGFYDAVMSGTVDSFSGLAAAVAQRAHHFSLRAELNARHKRTLARRGKQLGDVVGGWSCVDVVRTEKGRKTYWREVPS